MILHRNCDSSVQFPGLGWRPRAPGQYADVARLLRDNQPENLIQIVAPYKIFGQTPSLRSERAHIAPRRIICATCH